MSLVFDRINRLQNIFYSCNLTDYGGGKGGGYGLFVPDYQYTKLLDLNIINLKSSSEARITAK